MDLIAYIPLNAIRVDLVPDLIEIESPYSEPRSKQTNNQPTNETTA